MTASDTVLALSMGCPAGIGPEVLLKALAGTKPQRVRPLIYGDYLTLRDRCVCVDVHPGRIVRLQQASDVRRLPAGAIGVIEPILPLDVNSRLAGRPTPKGGEAQLRWIDAACDAVLSGDADALVTGPASKTAIATSGAPGASEFLGHTEWLARRSASAEVVMAFVADAFIVTLASTHLPLGRVATQLTADDVARAAYWGVRLVDDLAVDRNLAVAVLALNPHAGEDGLLGDEEVRIVHPGIRLASERLANEGRTRKLVGPLPAESAIRQTARDRRFAGCVAMYHDQATIPSKLLAFGDSVNVTLGLPFVRTSVDHGTAYDLAGKGLADARGMESAIGMALRLLRNRRHSAESPESLT